jgi:hypothetical protein
MAKPKSAAQIAAARRNLALARAKRKKGFGGKVAVAKVKTARHFRKHGATYIGAAYAATAVAGNVAATHYTKKVVHGKKTKSQVRRSFGHMK